MRCRDCAGEFGVFDALVPVFQVGLDDTERIEPSGYLHLWHLTAPDPEA